MRLWRLRRRLLCENRADRRIGDLQLSSVYLYEKIKEKYEITERGTLSGSDGYLRPFLCYEKKEIFRHGHVYVVQ